MHSDHADSPISDNPPAGFERHFKRSGLTDPWEPLYSRKLPDAVYIGLRAGPAHANSRGLVHGGLISALVDNAMGLSCGVVRGSNQGSNQGSLVTVNLSVDFVSIARQGQWVEVRPSVVKVGGSMGFASALVYADDAICARANATFRVIGS